MIIEFTDTQLQMIKEIIKDFKKVTDYPKTLHVATNLEEINNMSHYQLILLKELLDNYYEYSKDIILYVDTLFYRNLVSLRNYLNDNIERNLQKT